MAWETGFNGLANVYAGTIRFALRNVWTESLVVVIAVAALAGGIYLVTSGLVGAEFMPQEDDGQFIVEHHNAAGTNLAATDAAARQAEQIIRANVPEAP